eukprot:Mrub_14916.p1 GENE.Mrub_14916~~Mrub_14916.p1  ORF type:complete len:123 (+),score=8.47 Mrub_14916:2-370(+)
MKFQILSNDLKPVYVGMKISYKIKLFPYIPFRKKWITYINEVEVSENYKSFTYLQEYGPYTYWRHKIALSEKDNKIDLYDEYDYEMPLGLSGEIVHDYYVKGLLDEIWNYRKGKLNEIFNYE